MSITLNNLVTVLRYLVRFLTWVNVLLIKINNISKTEVRRNFYDSWKEFEQSSTYHTSSCNRWLSRVQEATKIFGMLLGIAEVQLVGNLSCIARRYGFESQPLQTKYS